MKETPGIIELLQKQKILPLFYADDAQTCIEITKTLYAAGIRIVEFTNRGNNAVENFRTLADQRNRHMPDLILLAGTIMNRTDVAQFAQAGADLLVSPVVDESMIQQANTQKIFLVPGCMTVTEIHRAVLLGCKLVKLFPGNTLQPCFVKNIRPIFPGLHCLVTGGIKANSEEVYQWLHAGAVAVGLGGDLLSEKLIETKEYALLQSHVAELLKKLL